MIGAPGGTRTPGPRLRRPLLYPTELQAHAAGRLPPEKNRRIQGKPAVSADRYALYHRTVPVSTDFSPLRIDKTTYAGYAMRVRGEQTVAGLRA